MLGCLVNLSVSEEVLAGPRSHEECVLVGRGGGTGGGGAREGGTETIPIAMLSPPE